MTRSKGLRHTRSTLSFEPLEERRLLSFYSGPSTVRPVVAGGALYQITVSGGGYERIGHTQQGIQVNLLGTTSSSTLAVKLIHILPHSRQLPLNIAAINVESGQLGSIQALGTANLTGPITPLGNVSSIEFNSIIGNAQINVAGDLGGLVAGNIALNPSGAIRVGHDLTGPLEAGVIALNGASIAIGNDATAKIAAASITLAHNGTLSIGRDATAGITVGDNLKLDTGGGVKVGRELDGLTIQGNLVVTPSGGAVSVGGDLTNLTIDGVLQGNGTSRPDLSVGLSLVNLSVQGGEANAGGIENASIAVAKSIIGFNVAHGVFNSLITAGVAINGQSGPGDTVNIGPDGTNAVFDSEIRAGQDIINFLIGGDVASDYVTNPNPTGYRTRIIAGETPQGTFTSGGLIDNFQITGSMTDSVLAASVAPYGGNGTLPPTGYGSNSTTPVPPGDGGANTYDQPAGVIVGGVVGATISYANYSEVSYYNELPTGVAYNPADPTIDDDILPGGAINPSFASAPLASSALVAGATLPLPTRSTVLGGVISTPHGDNQDYAGIFAADTSGVFVGKLPVTSAT
ncbi:MAG: hypothetical protein P4L84_17540 [Isosphaeraceae bacterium]|nr:hypothetical protein [Isosphaeraceae bacterium]